MNTNELLKQCRKWHEQNEYRKIIDTLEEIPEEERTCEIDMELARAYNNRAVSEEPVNRVMLKRAIDLMEPYCDELEEDHSWNFRMGYAHFYLEQEGQARWYFEDALKYHPGDAPRYTSQEQIRELIEICEARLALPDFRENFRQRTVRAWETFAARETDLRRLLNEEKIEEVLTICRETLHIAFLNIAFEIGVGGKKPELILTPEEDRVKLFELLYFRRHAPSEVLENWEIRLGRQPVTNVALHSDDVDVAADDVRVWVEEYKEGTVALTLYSEKFLPLLRDDEDNEDRVLWLAGALVGNVVGEIPYMRYVAYLHVKGEPDNTPSVSLAELPEKLEELGYDLSISTEELLEIYCGYQMKPDNDPDAIWRADVIAGSSSCFQLIEDYMQDDVYSIDDLHADGAVAGFLIYRLDSFDGEDRDKKIFDFREELEAYLGQNAGADAVTLTGGATGISFGYLDFIAWDLRAVLSAAKEFFENSKLTFAGFHVFRQGPDYVTLIDRGDIRDDAREIEKGDDTENASFYITLNLNARLQPMHRFELEDELDDRLNDKGLGFVDGGGTFTKEGGEVSACDIHIALTDGSDETIDVLATIIEDMGVPKGSELIWKDGRRAVGSLEGLALSLDGTGLPAEVYQTNDINEVIEKINGLLGEMLVYFSWWEGPKNTVLYYYGTSYEKMLAAITDFIGEHPLCQNCVVEQIAGE